ncbi:MAG: macro domain-containing protein [Alphaproteobacteria bacterium]|nr:macro domain-containing protein [Alphaproteobacteria bacterium]
MTFEILVARLETLAVDAIVNAANRWLAPGGGVDGAIRRAAGPALDAHLAKFDGLEVGGALVTPGFQAPSRFIIHTVAPIWIAPGDPAEKSAALAACYANTFAAADAAGLGAIAYPALGAGAYGWPMTRAAAIAAETLKAQAVAARAVSRVILCCFTENDAAVYRPLFG